MNLETTLLSKIEEFCYIYRFVEKGYGYFSGENLKQKYRLYLKMLHSKVENLNRSKLQDDAKESNFRGNSYVIDVPLLLTMTAWFLMLYVGITKFIKANTMHSESYKTYMQGMTAVSAAATRTFSDQGCDEK